MRLRRLLPLIVVFGLLPAPSASAAQLDARDDPEASSELTLESKRCRSSDVKSERAVIALLETCVYFFTFDDLQETDVLRDYGVAWLQLSIEPRAGWCTTKLEAAIEVDAKTTTYDQVPQMRERPSRPVTVENELVVDGEGRALSAGFVRQRFTLHPKELVPLLESNAVGIQWKGRSGAKLAFALGVEIGWRTLDPLESFTAGARSIKLVQRC